MKRLLCIAMFAVALMLPGSPVTLVNNGKAVSMIILDDKPTASAQMAALEINFFLKKISGTELPVIKKSEKSNSTGNIIITSELPRKLTGEFWQVAYDQNNIIICGKDSPVYNTVNYAKVDTFPKVEFAYNGTLFGAYQFLEDALGVRFFGPEDADCCFTPSKTVTADGVTKEYIPKFDAFRISTCYYNYKLSRRQLHLWQLRWRQCEFFGRTNHNQYSIYFKHWGIAKRKGFDTQFIQKRPELFAKGYTGKAASVDPILQTNYPGDKNIPPQLCYSNPQTVKYYADEVMTYFNGGNVKGGWLNFSAKRDEKETLLPRFEGKPFFYPVQGGDTGGYCKCADCQKNYKKQNVSNAKFKFIADVATEAAKKNPAAGVSTLAYISTLGYPENVKLPPNVAVQLCLTYYNWYHPVAEKLQYAAYKKWIKKEGKNRPLFLWLYTFGPSWDANHHYGKYKTFPGFYPHFAAEKMKEFAADGIRGIFSETEMTHLKLEAYLICRLAVDPTLDTQKIIDDFFVKYYGPAAKYMKEFYSEIEKAYFNPKNIPGEFLKNKNSIMTHKGKRHPYWGTGITSAEINWGKMGTPERMKKLKKLMAQAENAVKNHTQAAARLNLFKRNTWNMALVGEAEYNLLAVRMKNPLPVITPAETKSDDWDIITKDMTRSSDFLSLNGSKMQHKSNFGLAYDQKNLYLEYTDNLKPIPNCGIWQENIEVFFVSDKILYHMAIPLDGPVVGYRCNIADKTIIDADEYNFNIKPESKYSANGWRVRMTVPWQKLGLQGNSSLGINVCRTYRNGSSCWSPTFANSYRDRFPYFGKMLFYPIKLNAANFTCHGKSASKKNDGNNGTVGVMLANAGWSLQCPMPQEVSPEKTYEVWAILRGDIEPSSMQGKSYCGIYNRKTRKTIGSIAIPAAKISGEKYQRVRIGKFKLSPDMYFYIGGLNPKHEKNKIYLKEVEIFEK